MESTGDLDSLLDFHWDISVFLSLKHRHKVDFKTHSQTTRKYPSRRPYPLYYVRTRPKIRRGRLTVDDVVESANSLLHGDSPIRSVRKDNVNCMVSSAPTMNNWLSAAAHRSQAASSSRTG